MKRRILSSTNYTHNGAFEQLSSDAYDAGYDLEVDDNLNVIMTARRDANILPTVTIRTEQQSDGTFWFIPTLEFPTLTWDENQFNDSIHYVIKQWDKVGQFMTQLNSFIYNPSSWIDE